MDSSSRAPVKLVFTVLIFLLVAPLHAFVPPGHDKTLPDKDKRLTAPKPAKDANGAPPALPGRAAAMERLRRQIPDVRVEEHPLLRTPKHIAAPSGFLSGRNGEGRALPKVQRHGRPEKDPHRPVLDFLDEHAALFGHGAEILDRAPVRRDSLTPHNGLRTIVWEQRVDGIAVDEAVLIGNVTSRGELVSISSQFLPEAERAADLGTPHRADAQLAPPIQAIRAIVLAAQDLGQDLEPGEVQLLDPRLADAEQRGRYKAGGLPGEAQARLLWLPMGQYSLRLCWEVGLTRPEGGERYQVLVDALTGEVLVRRRLTVYLSEATYRVFTSDSPTPFSPGWPKPNSNQPPAVARSLVTLGALDTNASPIGWISDGENETRGNNVDAHLDRNGDDMPDLPRPQGSPFRVFDPPLDFASGPGSNTDAAVVQLFYWCNWMHDRLYRLGFTEAAGNFQKDNFGRGGLGNDAIQADAQDGSGLDNANFTPSPDGNPGRIQMFIWNGPTPNLDGDLDAEVILHEYTHGLSTRLVGGGAGITAAQTAGMGEGWSDFYALSLLSQRDDNPEGTYPFGAYVVRQLSGLRENYYYGIRRYPYSVDLEKNPLTFKDIDPFQISLHAGVPLSPLIGFNPLSAGEVHAQGEVWCSMLWEARAAVIRRLGFSPGNETMLRLVTDGMKLSPPNPTFTQARDAILLADLIDNQGGNYADLWAAFAKRGLGFRAVANDATTTSGVLEAYDLPDALFITQADRLISSGPQGGPFSSPCRSYPLTNLSSGTLAWSVHATQPWISINPPAGTLPSGGSTLVQICFNAGAATLPAGIFADTLIFSNAITGVTQERQAELTVMNFTTMPFTEDFESGDLQPFWSASGTASHAIIITPFNEPHGGKFHVTLDANGGIRSRNELTLGIDLAGYTNVVLRFWARSFGDEPDGPPPTPFFGGADFDGVAVSEDGVAWYEVQPLRALGFNYQQVVVDLDAALAKYGLHYNDHFRIRFNQVDDFQIPFDGIALDDITLRGDGATRLTVTLPAEAREGAGLLPTSGVVKVGVPVTAPVAVSLVSSRSDKVRLPGSVLIPAGADHVSFPITVLDDSQLDGTTLVTVRADAPGFVPASAAIRITDNERAVLKVRLPPHTREGAGLLTKQGVVRANGRPARDVAIELECSDSNRLQVARSVLLHAGEMSASFDLVVLDDDRIDGPHEVTVRAHVDGWEDGSDRIQILDNNAASLLVQLPASVGENAGVRTNAGVVRVSGLLPTNLVVSLASSEPGALRVPATAFIRSNEWEGRFNLVPVDNDRVDGRHFVTVTARATGFAAGSAALGIDDDETPPLPTQPNPANGSTNVPVAVNLVWNPGVGNILVNGGFETGDFTGWTQINGGFGGWVINDGNLDPDGPEGTNAPLAGKFSVLLTQTGGGNHQLYQQVFLPADALGATLNWSDRIHNYASHYAPNQVFRVEIRDENNSVLTVAYETRAGDALLNDWNWRSFDLTSFRGRMIRVAFVEIDSIGYMNVGLDEVSVALTAPGVPTTFDLYFGSSPTLGKAEFQGSLTNALWSPPRLALETGYYWQVISRRGPAQSVGPVWKFTTRAPGRLDHFEWGRIASPQYYNQQFAVTLTAKDAANSTLNDFKGSVTVAAQPGAGTRSSIVVTELDIGNNDRAEFANASGRGINLAGWQITLYDTFSWPDPLTTLVLPDSICPPGTVFKVNDDGQAPGRFPDFNAGTNVTWSLADFGNPIAVLVQDPAGNIVDFVCAGTADPSLISRPVSIPRQEWRGLPVIATLPQFSLSLQRVGNADHDDASDWIPAPATFGQRNGDLFLPFPAQPSLAVAPALLTNFVTGIWAGYLTMQDVAPSVNLKADDGRGHTGLSGPFTVGAADDLDVSVTDTPNVVLVGQTLSYSLLIHNFGPSAATGVVLTNLLPIELTFLSADTFDGACRNDGAEVVCQLQTLHDGDTARVTIHARAVQPGTLTNLTMVTRAEPDGYTNNNQLLTLSTATFPYLSTTNIVVPEGDIGTNLAMVPVRLSAPSPFRVSVGYATSNGTAIAGVDYVAVSGRLEFDPGVTNLYITIPILGDTLNELTETFVVNLFAPSNAVLMVRQARCRIQDDDRIPTLSINDVTVTEGAPGSTTDAQLTVWLSAPSGLTVNIDYTTEDDSALAPLDYLATFGTLTFASGTLTQFVHVPVRGDKLFESNEVFHVTLFNPVGAFIQRAQGSVTILDDDAGELEQFVWDAIPSPQNVGAPFSARLTALNGLGLPATNFNGPVTLRGVAQSRENTAGQGTNTWEFPLGTLYHDARTQVIYLPPELGGPGRLNALALDVTALPGQTLGQWTVRMKHTTRTDQSDAAWEADGWTTVYQNDEIIQGRGWVLFLFDQPFAYDGTNSLMVDFSFDNATYSTNGLVRSSPTPVPRALAFQTDSAFGDPKEWKGKTAPPPRVVPLIPNARFFMEVPAAVSPTGTIQLTNGGWAGLITASQPGAGLFLRASDREGHIATSNPFDVQTASGDTPGLPGLPPANRIIGSIQTRGADRILTFSSVPGKFYRLERTGDLSRPQWIGVGPDLSGNGGVLEAMDSGGAARGTTFYRLRILP